MKLMLLGLGILLAGVPEIQKATDGALAGTASLTSVRSAISQALGCLAPIPVTLSVSGDGSFLTLAYLNPWQKPVIFWAAQPVTGNLEVRFVGMWPTVNFNTVGFTQSPQAVFGVGWALGAEGHYDDGHPADVTVHIDSGRMKRPEWRCP